MVHHGHRPFRAAYPTKKIHKSSYFEINVTPKYCLNQFLSHFLKKTANNGKLSVYSVKNLLCFFIQNPLDKIRTIQFLLMKILHPSNHLKIKNLLITIQTLMQTNRLHLQIRQTFHQIRFVRMKRMQCVQSRAPLLVEVSKKIGVIGKLTEFENACESVIKKLDTLLSLILFFWQNCLITT